MTGPARDLTALPGFYRVTPRITVGPAKRPLAAAAADLVERVVVDTHTHLPDMFEITFADQHAVVGAGTGLSIGTAVTIVSATVEGGREAELITGEVTAIEASYTELNRTIVRGYTADHRLQRARRNRTYLNAKDSDIARRIATEHGLRVGTIEATRTAHDHVGQVNQTDWEFLRWRADAIGYDFGVRDGQFFFTKAVAARTARKPIPLEFPGSLRSFTPRVTAGNLAPQAEVRVWDPAAARTTGTVVPVATGSVDLDGADPAALARTFQPKKPPAPAARKQPGAADLGPAPTDTGVVLATSPVAGGAGIDPAAREVAQGAAERWGSTVAEAEGEALGDPAIRAGSTVEVSGVGALFCGRWVVTRACHSHDLTGYVTRFEVSGRQDRSLLGLGAGKAASAPTIPGVVCGVVCNIGDPQNKGRVRVALPWLSPQFESDWAVVVHPGAGRAGGTVFQPGVGDEVLVAFEFGDPRRPYVLGGLFDDRSVRDLGGEPVKKSGASASVVWRGMVTPTGNRLAFHDEVAPGRKPTPIASDFVLGTGGGDLALVVDQMAGTVTLRCVPAAKDGRPAAPGKLTIECGKGGTIDVRTGEGGTVNVGGGARLNLTGKASVKIESTGPVEIKGNPIKLN